MSKRLLVIIGVVSIVLSVVIFGAALWEGFGGAGRNIKILEAPGFQELDIDTPGVYAGVYQHRGEGPVPVEALSKLDVRIISKDSFQDIPVLMNGSGQAVNRLGFKGMVVFNVMFERPGFYSFTALYKDGVTGPTLPLLFFSQSENVQLTFLVGGIFALIFLVLGIVLIVRSRKI